MPSLLRQAIRYRELLASFIGRELRARYRGSVLGGLWLVLQPGFFLAVYYFIFVKVLDLDIVKREWFPADALLSERQRAYIGNPSGIATLALFVALVPWTSLQECVMRSVSTIQENGSMIKKIAFPAELLAVYLVACNMVNICVGFSVVLLAQYFAVGILPDPAAAWLIPVGMLLQAIFMLGVSYFLSTVTVFIRDVAQIVPTIMLMLFFFTPIIMVRVPKPEYAGLIAWNPLASLMDIYRMGFLFPPGCMAAKDWDTVWRSLIIFGSTAIAMAVFGYRTFMKHKADFADEL